MVKRVTPRMFINMPESVEPVSASSEVAVALGEGEGDGVAAHLITFDSLYQLTELRVVPLVERDSLPEVVQVEIDADFTSPSPVLHIVPWESKARPNQVSESPFEPIEVKVPSFIFTL